MATIISAYIRLKVLQVETFVINNHELDLGKQFYRGFVSETKEKKPILNLMYSRKWRTSQSCPELQEIQEFIKECGLEGKIDISINRINHPTNKTKYTGITLIGKESFTFAVHSNY